MGIGPLELSGAISRTTDFANIRHNQENKTMVDQTNVNLSLNRQAVAKANTVERGNDANNDQKKFDAKEKGSNEYSGDGGKRRNNQNNKNKDGIVIPKGPTGGFDIRI